MSLINDALKRARENPSSQPSASELAASLRPAEEHPRAFPILPLMIVLIPVIVAGVWFLVKGLRMHDHPTETVAARAPAPVAETPAVAAPTLAPIAVIQPTNTAVTHPPPVIPPTPQPVFKLQGIYWRPSRPSAVVNGKTVYVGDRVETARVTAIDKEGVTLSVNGQPKVLLLP